MISTQVSRRTIFPYPVGTTKPELPGHTMIDDYAIHPASARELLEKEILFNSPTEYLYFHNKNLYARVDSLRVTTAYLINDETD